MPTYDYRCENCGHEFEEMQSMVAEQLTVCPKCGKSTLKRMMGGGAGMIFKGSGFYLTDYAKSGAGPKETKSGKPESSSKKEETKSDTKSKSKSESKSETKSESKTETKSDSKGEKKSDSKSSDSSGSKKSE